VILLGQCYSARESAKGLFVHAQMKSLIRKVIKKSFFMREMKLIKKYFLIPF